MLSHRIPFLTVVLLATALYLPAVHAQTAALAASGAEPASSAIVASSLNELLHDVYEIAAPGAPGSLAVFGPNAFPVVAGASGKNAWEPVVAAARAGAGRVVAFGHTSYLDKDTLRILDTGRLFLNAVGWAGGKAQPEVAVFGQPQLASWLGVQRFHPVRDLRDLHGEDVLIISAHDITEDQFEPIRQFVAGGGGLITVATGWGWEQLNPGRSLATDFPANRLLAPWGLVFTGGFLNRTGRHGFGAAGRPSPLASANHSLDAALLYIRGQGPLAPADMEQVETVVTHAAGALPPDDTLFMPRLRELTHSMTGDIVPFPGKPVAKTDLAARLLLTLQINTLKALPPDEVRAHPAGAIFPGEVPVGARTTRLTIPIDTSVPDWHSLGLYAAPGALMTVQIPASAAGKGLGVRIGAHTDTLWDQDKWERAPEISRSFSLNGLETRAANAFGGLVYVTVPQDCKLGVIPVVVNGAVLAPLYARGQTSVQEWHDSIRKRPGPWAELASDKIILTVPSRVARTLDDPEALMQYWDAGMDAVADLAGIPHTRKRPERIVADQQISAGYMHSGYPIMTWLDVANLDVDLSELMKGDWGHWHEMGHNHQAADWTFEGTGEVTNNMFPLYVNEKVAHIPGGLAHPNVQPAWQKKAIHDYLTRGAHFEEWKSDPFLALSMYIQLRDAFGWDAYKKVFAEYRTLPAGERPKTDDEKRDQWMVRFSRVAGRNLGPFFQRWGVPTSQAARDSIAKLPGWMPAGMD